MTNPLCHWWLQPRLSASMSDASLDLAVVSEDAALPLNVSVRVLYSLGEGMPTPLTPLSCCME